MRAALAEWNDVIGTFREFLLACSDALTVIGVEPTIGTFPTPRMFG